MANECQAVFSLSYRPPVGRAAIIEQFTEHVSPSSLVSALSKSVVLAAGVDTVVSLAELASPGKVYIENTDTVNYVDFGPESAGAIVPLQRLLPTEFDWWRLKPGAVLRAMANTGPVTINILVVPT